MPRLSGPANPQADRPLLKWLVAIAVVLTAALVGLELVAERGQLLAILPWYVPMIHSFVALAALSISFLAFGRFAVQGAPFHFWLGMAFGSFAVASIFYVLSWPGILPPYSPEVSQVSLNASSWFWHLGFSLLPAFLLMAHLLDWPHLDEPSPGGWVVIAIGLSLVIVVVCSLSLSHPDALPVLVDGGAYNPLNVGWSYLLVATFAIATALSIWSYGRDGDPLVGGLAVGEVVLTFAILTSVLGASYYDVWWYSQRVLWVVGFSAVLGSQLVEYVGLYRRELDRAQALATLQRQMAADNRRLQALIGTTPVGIVVREAPDGRLVLSNDAAVRIFGQPPAPDLERLAEAPARFGYYSPNGSPLSAADVPDIRALRGEVVNGVELLIVQPSGRRLNLLVNATALRDEAGTIESVILAYQDISALREQEKLREDFLAAAAHELKTPITAIRGYSQLLRRAEPPADPGLARRSLDVIDAQSARLAKRIQEMIDVVGLRVGALPGAATTLDLADLVRDAVTQARAARPTTPLIVRRLDPATVTADAESTGRVIETLLENAARRAAGAGEIVVELRASDGEATLAVADEGELIPAERQSHFFEPFYETFPSGDLSYRGEVALDLAICRLIVERLRGRISFESGPERTVFFVRLPLSPPETGAADAPADR